MNYKFESEGKILYGVPYVAKINIEDDKLVKKYIETDIEMKSDGNVKVTGEYEADNYEIVEMRYGSFGMEEVSLYYLTYRNKLIDLGFQGDIDLENYIIDFLLGKINVVVLLKSIDEFILDKFEDEIQEIFKEHETNKKGIKTQKIENNIKFLNTVKEFIEYGNFNVQFNDYHFIFCSKCEKVNICLLAGNNLYMESGQYKLNIQSDKIKDKEILTDNGEYKKIEIEMIDNAKIILSR